MKTDRVYALTFAGVYPHYIRKADAKGRTKAELDQVIEWLTGFARAPPRNQSGFTYRFPVLVHFDVSSFRSL